MSGRVPYRAWVPDVRLEAITLGAALVAAWIGAAALLGSEAGATPRAAVRVADRLDLRIRTPAANAGVEANAAGGVDVRARRRGSRDRQRIALSLSGLAADSAYRLDASFGDDPAPVAVTGLTTGPDGSFSATYSRRSDRGLRPNELPLPGAVDSVGRIRELAVVDASGQVVLRTDLSSPEFLKYDVRRPMESGDSAPQASGALRIDADQDLAIVRVRARGLRPKSPCRVVIGVGGDPVTTTTSAAGELKVTHRLADTAGLFDLRQVALADDTSGDVVLRAGTGSAGWGLPAAPPAPIPDLVSGAGFTSATSQPAAIGSGPGSDAKAIARWDVVPYQTITGKFPVGVVAFHMAGIDRVEFSVEGGPWTAVRAMTKNPVTGVWEYNAHVDAATLADGRAEVRAVVYPVAGIPRVLAGPLDQSDLPMSSGEHSVFLAANHGGTLSEPVRHVSPAGSDQTGDGSAAKPFATIGAAANHLATSGGAADGATIYLAAGDYAYPDVASALSTTDRWITLCAAPGLTRDQVRITSSAGGRGLNASLVHLRRLTLHGAHVFGGSTSSNWRVWADDCAMEGSGPGDNLRFFTVDEWTGIYASDCSVRNVTYPCLGFTLTRNTVVSDSEADGIRDPAGIVINVEVKNLIQTGTSHNDVVQLYDPWPRTRNENLIFYGLKGLVNCDAQGLFVSIDGDVVVENVAFVNFAILSTAYSQWSTPANHLLFWNCDLMNSAASIAADAAGAFVFVDTGARPTRVHDLSIRNSVIGRFQLAHTGSEPSPGDTSWADGNHFIDVTTHGSTTAGTNFTTGGTYASIFRDAPAFDLTPAAGSPILGRVGQILAPADAAGRVRRTPDAVGSFTLP